MQILSRYPVSEAELLAHCGRPVGAVLANGDCVCGILDRVHDGHLVFRPITGVPEAQVAQFRHSIKRNFRPGGRNRKPAGRQATTSAWGFGGGYPYGWRYGNYGWGAGWWWLLPLFLLTALVAFPFWI